MNRYSFVISITKPVVASVGPAPRRAVLTALLLQLLTQLPGAPAAGAHAAGATAAPTNLRMQNIVKAFVAETGEEVIGLGSWISGRSYSATSDHDMRLVCRGQSPDALRRWQAARTRLAAMVRSEFGRDADRVLRTVNLYPPSQLMAGVEDAADAAVRFEKIGQVPNLSVQGVPRNVARYSEGLYGGGARAWTQGYEQSAGRLFYREGDRVFMGMTDLTHMSEGLARYDVEGMANTSRQWLSHIDDAVAAGDRRAIAKYLDRLNRDLAKAKNLGRLEMDMAFRTEMSEVSRALRSGTSSIPSALRARLESVTARAGREADVLRLYARSGSTVRGILSLVLKAGPAGDRLRRLASEAGEALTFEKAVRAVVLYVELRKSLAYAAEDDFQRAYRSALAGTLGLVNLPAGLVAELGGWALDAIESTGIGLVASTQEAWDLMAGVHTVYGREDVDAGRGYTLEDLVRSFDDESRLESLVRLKAKMASERGFGGVAATTDERVADAVFRRCWPVIRDAWRLEREKLAAEFETLCEEMARMPVLMSYAPNPARAEAGRKTEVTVTARVRDPEFDARRERLKQVLDLLCHTSTYVNTAWRWKSGGAGTGTEGREPWIRAFAFEGAGRKPVELSLDLRVGATGRWRDSPFTREVTCPSGIDVEIVAADTRAEEPAAVGTTTGYAYIQVGLNGTGFYNSTCSWDRSMNRTNERRGIGAGFTRDSVPVQVSGRDFEAVVEMPSPDAPSLTFTLTGTFSANRRTIERLVVTGRMFWTEAAQRQSRRRPYGWETEGNEWTFTAHAIPYPSSQYDRSKYHQYKFDGAQATPGVRIEDLRYAQWCDQVNPPHVVGGGTWRVRLDQIDPASARIVVDLRFHKSRAFPAPR